MGKRRAKRNKKNEKKIKNTYLSVKFEKPSQISGFEMSDGKIKIFDENNEVIKIAESSVGSFYESTDRMAKGKDPKKICQRMPLLGQTDLSFVSSLKNFDVLYAIDTSTKDGLSVCAVIRCDLWHLNREVISNISQIHTKSFSNVENPENFGWFCAIREIINNNFRNLSKRVGIVVDCNLGNIPQYNHRQLPIYSDFFLPPNIQLIYASADAGSNFLNFILKKADQEAKNGLNKVKREV
jgi:hypothetical protein